MALPEAHRRTYARRLAAVGLSDDAFLATYSQVLRIVPTRFLPWHGRTTRSASRATASIEEPVPLAARESRGERHARRLEHALRPSRSCLPGWLGEPIAAA